MSVSPTLGIFVFLLFAYTTPAKGEDNAMDVSQVSFNNGKEYPTPDLPGEFEPKLKLIRKLNGSYYKIEQIGTTSKGTTTHTVERFVIRGLDTLLRKFVVVRTNDHSYFEMKTRTEEDAQRLFDMTTGRKLGASLYSYDVSAVYKFQEGRILENVSISGFAYATKGNPQERYMIHSGSATNLIPHLLWTEDDYFYAAYGEKSILVTVAKRIYGTYEDYLVEFANRSDWEDWIKTPGQHYTRNIRIPVAEIVRYFNFFVAP